jgi:adenine phosphoribosyltransferase
MDLKDHIRQVPDFPKPGIQFYDISTLLAHADAWQVTMGRLANAVRAQQPDLLVGIESRGFLVAAPLALKLEYGTDIVEIQKDAIKPGQRVVVLDDLLATGGTLQAAIALLRQVGAEVTGAACIIELAFLKGRENLDVPVTTMVSYES